jgi:hypothetical protein
MSYNYDQVSVKKSGGYNLISGEEFRALPLDERVKLITEGKVHFLKEGQVIPAKEALKRIDSEGDKSPFSPHNNGAPPSSLQR